MADILYRAELHTPEQARAALKAGVLPWIGQQLEQGRELVMEVRLLDDDITDKQRAYLHAVVLAEIAQFTPIALTGGTRYSMKTWKEHFRKEWLGFTTVSDFNPLTGKRVRTRVRKSTEDLGVKAMADYIDRIIAYAATDLGVQVSEPLPPELRPQRRRARAIEAGNVDADGVIQTEEATA